MDLTVKKEISTKELIILSLSLLFGLGFQVLVIKSFPQYAFLILIFFISVLILIIVITEYLRDFQAFLVMFIFLPLILLNNIIQYDFTLELINFIPLFLLILLSFYYYILNEKNLTFRVKYLQFPIILLTLYFGINALISIAEGRRLFIIIVEYFHFLLYLSIIPILYLFRDEEKYKAILKFLFIISILISIEYIFYGQYSKRFVTFQSGFLPLSVGVTFAYFLFSKSSLKRILSLILLFILFLGTFLTLTRTLWIISFLVLLIDFVIYLIILNKLTVLKTVFLLLILVILFVLAKDSIQKAKGSIISNKTIEQRTESISDPLEDVSFLMRVELDYYAIQKFLKHPIFGSGLGDFVKYKIIKENVSPPVYYLDSSWLYMLWKGGIIGFLLFAWIYYRFFKASFFVLRNSKNLSTKIICLGLLSGFIGLSFLALLSPLLIKYKTNFLIVFLFAYIEFERSTIINLIESQPKSLSIN